MKDKILKIVKGLRKFTIEDISIIAELDEEEIYPLIEQMVSEQKIIQISHDQYMKAEKIIKTKRETTKKGKIGFKKAAQNFMTEAENKCTPSTFKSYKSAFNKHLSPFFQEFRICEIKPENIDEFIEQKIEEGLSNKTIDNIAKLLGSILEKALKDRYIPFNPARAVKKLYL